MSKYQIGSILHYEYPWSGETGTYLVISESKAKEIDSNYSNSVNSNNSKEDINFILINNSKEVGWIKNDGYCITKIIPPTKLGLLLYE